MKIRIKGDSVRFRLTRSEVDKFADEGYIEERTEFGNSTLIYALQRVTEGDKLSASFNNNKITLLMPVSIAQEWTSTEKVGYDARMNTGGQDTLYLLLEKDFKCLDETIEDQSDNYDNPLAMKA